MSVGNFLKALIYLWRAPAETKKKAEGELASRLAAEVPQHLLSKANQLRGTKRWKVLLAAKVRSIQEREKRIRLESSVKGPDPRLGTQRAKETLTETLFTMEWASFIESLVIATVSRPPQND